MWPPSSRSARKGFDLIRCAADRRAAERSPLEGGAEHYREESNFLEEVSCLLQEESDPFEEVS
jgi:hypothetical protein